MSSNSILTPRVSLNLISTDSRIGVEDHRNIIFGQKTSGGSAVSGALVQDVPRDDAGINALFGADSHAAMIARAYRAINPVTNLDAIVLDDNPATPTAAAGTITFSGTATASGRLTVVVADNREQSFSIDVVVGDTASDVGDKLATAVSARVNKPYTITDASPLLTFTSVNAGTLANGWPLSVTGRVAGITSTVVAFASGATDPVLTNVFDPIANIRYQGVFWPSTWITTGLKTFMGDRFNVDNLVMDGRAFIGRNDTLTNLKSQALALNSPSIIMIGQEPTSEVEWKGPHTPDSYDVVASRFMASRGLRFEDARSISQLVVTNASNDQFGGIHTSTLPYFNTPMLGAGQPLEGSGFNDPEMVELRDAGVSVYGKNRVNNAVIYGEMATTYQNDAAGNEDETWKFLNWIDSHSTIREYFAVNLRNEFAQSRLTIGATVANYDITNEDRIKSYLLLLYDDLAELVITVAGDTARKWFRDNTDVTIDPGNRRVTIASRVPMVSQLGEIIGTVQYSFSVA